ncbi:MAG: tryptophan synthase subunit alpha [Rhodospirillaceae bacterium]|nr:tryptophan synthase subunit alpha [Rhodospirillaceae bacterium]
MNKYSKKRLKRLFDRLSTEDAAALGVFVTACDPDFDTSLNILRGLPSAGADMIELGMPFSDPMADGPSIQASSQRALKAGGSLFRTLELVRLFRETDDTTPLVLMGYYNPIYSFGIPEFLSEAITAGADGLIVVDLPPEEDNELCLPATRVDFPFIRLAAPTTNKRRLKIILQNASGFIYYVSITGITGTKAVPIKMVRNAVQQIQEQSELPIAVGFGIKTKEHVRQVTQIADAAIVGSAVVNTIADSLDVNGNSTNETIKKTLYLVRSLATGVRGTTRS